MFTGIIEAQGMLVGKREEGTNVHLDVRAPFTEALQVDQSVAHDGVCLTVVAIDGDVYTVTAIEETLAKTHLGSCDVGHVFNLERCAVVGDRIDGHPPRSLHRQIVLQRCLPAGACTPWP